MSTPQTLLAIALLACGFAANAAHEVYIANENADTVSVIDAASFKVLTPVRVGKMPHNVQLSPDGKFAWVTNHGEPDPDPAPWHPGMNKAEHAVMADTVSVIDISKRTVVSTVRVGKGPNGVSVSP